MKLLSDISKLISENNFLTSFAIKFLLSNCSFQMLSANEMKIFIFAFEKSSKNQEERC